MTTKGLDAAGFTETAGVIDRVIRALQADAFNDAVIEKARCDVSDILSGI